jgi:hypothetical protein
LHEIWILQCSKKICEINKEKPKMKTKTSHWAGLCRLPPVRMPDSLDPPDRERSRGGAAVVDGGEQATLRRPPPAISGQPKLGTSFTDLQHT